MIKPCDCELGNVSVESYKKPDQQMAYYCLCNGCKCVGPVSSSKQTAIKAWNTYKDPNIPYFLKEQAS